MNPALGSSLYRALLRVFVAVVIVLVLHLVTRFPPELLVGIGAAAALLLLAQGDSVAGVLWRECGAKTGWRCGSYSCA